MKKCFKGLSKFVNETKSFMIKYFIGKNKWVLLVHIWKKCCANH